MLKKRANRSQQRNGHIRRQTSLYSRTEEIKERKESLRLFNFKYFIIFISLLGAGYLVFFSSFLRVNEVVISETKFASREEIQKTLDKNNNLLNKNIVTFGFWGVNKPLKKITGISEVKILRKSLNRVELNIVEEFPLLTWQTSDKKYLISELGSVWAPFEEKYASLPIVIDNKNLPVNIGDKILPSSFVTFFKELETNFNDAAATKIVKLEVLDIVSDLKVSTEAGWYVVFDTSRTSRNQLISLKRVLEEVRIKGKKLEYIDLRIDNRIFYK